MKVAVLGAGVIGITTAYCLARAGHQVVVVDRQPGPALETSFANAGEISPGYASPWAAPGVPMKALGWLIMRHAPLILRPSLDPEMWRWLAAMMRNCTAPRYAVNKARMVRLAHYSRERLIALRAQTGIQYDHRSRGTLQLFREQRQLDGIGKDVAVLRAAGIDFRVLDRADCLRVEPGLASATDPLVGGLQLPDDETGDCFMFTMALADLAEAEGVRFEFGTTIDSLERSGDEIAAVRTSQGTIRADRYVVALGSYAPRLLRPLGLRLPVYPVKGYSITASIVDSERAPVSTLLDDTYKIAITRLGDRIRVGGLAELAGYSTDLPAARRDTLIRSVGSLFPAAANLEEAALWSGLRPMTPDSTPVVGPTPISNLYLNCGHGTLGWTMACGSAQVLSDLISGNAPDIDASDLSIGRYGG